MIKHRKRTREEVIYWQEIRRSNAAGLHSSKVNYSRKQKHKGKVHDNV